MLKSDKIKLLSRVKRDEIFIAEVMCAYEKLGRHDLPWRKNITPYRILVSEIMLQQTQVSRVVNKFLEWMKVYPTLSSLSKSDLKRILLLWQGLGYQRRAKALYSISKQVHRVPNETEKLLALPGIGKYTASAIQSFAYNTFSTPMIETNIRTALIHFFHIDETDVSDGALEADLLRLAAHKKVNTYGARQWYYALMDFGAALKEKNISHNKKSSSYRTQSKYEGSLRKLRAEVLFAITKGEKLPSDPRLSNVLVELTNEQFIIKNKTGYSIVT